MPEKEGAASEPERVAHVLRADLPEVSIERGYVNDPDRRAYRALREALHFGPRPALENDPSRKQLIPYVVVVDTDGGQLFTMRRRTAQSESRLHDRLSIGAGGHIAEEDESAETDPLRAGMERELHEELEAPRAIDPEYRGLLNDDTDEVGRVHLGLVYIAAAEREAVAVRERDKMAGEWMSLDQLAERRDQLESWSRLLLEQLLRDVS